MMYRQKVGQIEIKIPSAYGMAQGYNRWQLQMIEAVESSLNNIRPGCDKNKS